MAETETMAPDKRRGPQGPRQAKPIFLVVEYTDENGQAVKLDGDRLVITPTKDTSALVQMLTSGAGTKTVVSITPPSAADNGNPAS